MADHECVKDEVVAELKLCMNKHEERLHRGEMMFQSLEAQNVQVIGKLDSIEVATNQTNKRLFIDNGTLSFQTRVDRHQRLLSGIMWAVSLVATCVIGMGIKMILSALMK